MQRILSESESKNFPFTLNVTQDWKLLSQIEAFTTAFNHFEKLSLKDTLMYNSASSFQYTFSIQMKKMAIFFTCQVHFSTSLSSYVIWTLRKLISPKNVNFLLENK